jgi:hypothetical protein
MNNWILLLEERIGAENAATTVQLVALVATVATIIAANWPLLG